MKAFRFLFMRCSAFLFDMIFLSFLISLTLTVVVDVLGLKVNAIELIYRLSMENSLFKTLMYMLVIGIYYGLHVFFRKSTLGLWVTHQDFAEKLPSISKAASEDLDLVNSLTNGSKVSIIKRVSNAFLYSSFQMINVALFGLITVFAAFSSSQVAYHESVSGVRIISRSTKK